MPSISILTYPAFRPYLSYEVAGVFRFMFFLCSSYLVANADVLDIFCSIATEWSHGKKFHPALASTFKHSSINCGNFDQITVLGI